MYVLLQIGPYSLPKRLVHRGWFVTSFFHFQNIPFFLKFVRYLPTSSSSSSSSLCVSFSKAYYKTLLTQYVINVFSFSFFFFFVGYFFLKYPVLHYFIPHANDPHVLFLPSPTPQFETFQVFLIYFRSDQVTAQRNAMYRL